MCASAFAQPNKPTQAQIAQAGDLVKKAIAKSQAGDHALAIELYQQAYNIIPTAILLSNIGSEYQQSQKPADAVKYFCMYLGQEPAGNGATFATQQVKVLQVQLGNDVEDNDACKVKPKAAPTPPVVDTTTNPQVTGTQTFGNTGGPDKPVVDEHPGRGLVIAGIGVAVIGAVGVAVGVDFALKGKALRDDINNHDPATQWPTEYEGVPIANWNSQGHTWNVDAAVFGAIGGAVLITGGVMIGLGMSKHSSNEEHALVIPTAGAHDAGLALVGKF
ncbi:MAG: tetratricopeptide repeat protein [Kofleriaceae bacterium]